MKRVLQWLTSPLIYYVLGIPRLIILAESTILVDWLGSLNTKGSGIFPILGGGVVTICAIIFTIVALFGLGILVRTWAPNKYLFWGIVFLHVITHIKWTPALVDVVGTVSMPLWVDPLISLLSTLIVCIGAYSYEAKQSTQSEHPQTNN